VTFAVLPDLLGGDDTQSLADYLDDCRTKRNVSSYDHAGEVSNAAADELLAEGAKLRTRVLAWVRKTQPRLVPR